MSSSADQKHDPRLLELLFQQSLDGLFFMTLDEPVRWEGQSDEVKEGILSWACAHHRISRVNGAMVRQYGGTEEQVLGLTPGDLFAHDRLEGRRVWRQFFDQGRLHTVTHERRLDGSPIVIEGDYICLRDEEGRITGHFGVQRDITAEHERQESLERSQRELQELAARLQTAREDERTRIAREIHDELGQALTGLKLDLAWLRGRIAKNTPILLERADSMLARVDETMASVRRIATELRPSILDKMGLAAAIEWQAEEFGRRTGLTVEAKVALDSVTLSDSRTTPVFRILQEALTNIARHANAHRVEIRCEASDGGVELEVKDDGRGITPEQVDSGTSLGLIGLRERARYSGGWVRIEGEPGAGTTVSARIPARRPIDQNRDR